jgi:hypothetical protein
MAVCAVTRHAEHRTRERVGIPKKAVRRAAARAITRGVRREETEGGLRRYLDWLYWRGNGSVGNIILYGDKVYMFNVDTLVTVLTVPTAHAKQAARMMRKRRQNESTT